MDAEARLLEIAQQRPVVGADVNDQVPRHKTQQRRRLAAQFGEVLPQDLRGAAGVGIFGRKQDLRVDDQPELHELALPAAKEQGRIGRLLARRAADRPHLVDRRQITEEQDRVEPALSQIWQRSTTALAPVPAVSRVDGLMSGRSSNGRRILRTVRAAAGRGAALARYHSTVAGSPCARSILGE